MEQYLLLLLLAGIVAMDTTEGPQWLVSEPIVSCTLAGALFGDMRTGVVLGLFFQMIWIGYLPLGATRFYDSNMGSLIATSSLLAAGDMFPFSPEMTVAGFVPALFFGLWVSYIGIYIINAGRKINGFRTAQYLSLLELKQVPDLPSVHLAGVARSFLRGCLMAAVLVPVGMLICQSVRYLPANGIRAAASAAQYGAGAAAATVVVFYWSRNRYASLSAGAIGGFLWALTR